MPITDENALGSYLKDRRTRLDPLALGLPMTRRRTPGLRREEVAQRANVSTTWYTWLEQGRGGAPSADVIDRISHALILTEAEREHLFLLALGRPPEPRYQAVQGITPRLQRVLDMLEVSPALVRTATWDIVAWNRAATVVLADYNQIEASQRNILKLMFSNSRVRSAQPDWERVARFVVAAFRTEVMRAGASQDVRALVDELSEYSPEFRAMWKNNDVQWHSTGSKQLRHATAGMLSMEYSSFAVDGRPDLSMVIYNPATVKDGNKIRKLLATATTKNA